MGNRRLEEHELNIILSSNDPSDNQNNNGGPY